jgi:hypothetical protein
MSLSVVMDGIENDDVISMNSVREARRGWGDITIEISERGTDIESEREGE